MKKPLNCRVPALCACFLIAGVILSTLSAYFGLSESAVGIAAAVGFVLCLIVFVVIDRRKLLPFVLAAVFFAVGLIYSYYCVASYAAVEAPLGEDVFITGKAAEVGKTSNGVTYIIIENATAGGVRLKHRIIAYLSEYAGDYCSAGYSVKFYGELEQQNLISFGRVGYNATRGVKYVCYIGAGLRSGYGFSLFGEINSAIRGVIYANCDAETAGICTALLTGNTDGLSPDALSSFRSGGIAHVFAVSGLHIGVVYGVLGFIFKKLRLNRFTATALKIAFVTLYSGVCGFSPSSVRAVIACAVSGAAACMSVKYDGLNALAVAAIIILLINPLQLFDAGFVLSFSAMLGISLTAFKIKKSLAFLPDKISGGIATGWSAQLATAPALLTYFGNYPIVGLVLNIVLVPVVSVYFVVLLFCAIASLILPPFGSVLYSVGAFADLLNNLFSSAGFERFLFYGEFSEWIFLPFALIIVALSDKFNLKVLARGVVAGGAVIACIMLSVGLPAGGQTGASVVFGSGYRGGSVLFCADGGSVLIVTGNYKPSKNCAANYDAVVVLSDDEDLSVLFLNDFNYDSVYFRGSAINLPDPSGAETFYADSFRLYGASFAFEKQAIRVEYNGVVFTLTLDYKGDEYGGEADGDFELYCYANHGAVLYEEDRDYSLSVCGDVSYEITGYGEYVRTCVLPAG